MDPAAARAHEHVHGARVAALVVVAVRADERRVAVDCHGRLNSARAIQLCQALEPYGLLFVEEPTPPEDPLALKEVKTHTAIPIAATFFHLLATILSFLPGDDWNNFIGFFITLSFITVLFHIAFFLPRRIIQKVWNKGLLFRLLGGALNVLETAIGLAVFTLIVRAYPIIDWLERAVTDSSATTWLVTHLGFVETLLTNALRDRGIAVFAEPLLSLISQIFLVSP